MMIASDVITRNALWLPTLITSSTQRQDAGHERRHDRHLAVSRHARDLRAGRQPVVARHREQHPDRRRLNGQAADEDRDRAVGQEQVADGVSERLLHDVRQAEQSDVLVEDVLVRHRREQDHETADDRGRRDRADDRRRRVACADCWSPRRASPRCRTRTSRTRSAGRRRAAPRSSPTDGRRRSRRSGR